MAKRGKRKSISKKLRFEVFKRDSFKCQYCGKSAPDVLLEIDHIEPVKEGGKNDITNLLTSCRDCNSGKGAVRLDDNAVVEKQRKQLEELNERREQLKMMLEWREELESLLQEQVEFYEEKFNDLTGFSFTDSGRKDARFLVKKYGLNVVLDSLEIAVEKKLQINEDGKATKESVVNIIKYTQRVCDFKKSETEKPYLRDLLYVRGIIKNRFGPNYMDGLVAMLESAYKRGIPIDAMKEIACKANNFWEFETGLIDLMEADQDE